jgi:hypothetical protein
MRPSKKLLKRTGLVVLFVAAVLLIIHSVRLSESDKRLEEQIAAIRAAGDPVRFTDLAGPPIPPEQNADTFLRRARQDIESLEKELTPLLKEGSIWDKRQDAEVLAKIRSAWEAYPAILPLLEKAAACDRYDAGYDYSANAITLVNEEIENAGEFRSCIRILDARAAWQLGERQRDDALTTTILMLKLSRHFDSRSAVVLRLLVGFASRGVSLHAVNRVRQDGPVSASVREMLEAELLSHNMAATSAAGLKTERVLGVENFAMMPKRSSWFLRHMWNEDQSTYFEIMTVFIASMDQTYVDFQVTQSKLDIRFEGRRAPLAKLVMPAIQSFYESKARTEALIRCLLLLNKIAGLGDSVEPDALVLEQLNLPDSAMIDPYNGERLKIKKSVEGWMIYSVGRNLKDDGGILDDKTDVGFGPESSSEVE